VFRHSAAHLLAAGGDGPVSQRESSASARRSTRASSTNFLRDEPFTQEDLAKIEKKMHELAAQDLPNERKFMPQAGSFGALQKIQPDFQMASWWKKKPPNRWSPFTPPENSSTSAAVPTSLPPSASRHSN